MTDEEKALTKRQLSQARAYRDVFDNPAGRIVLLDLMKKANFLQFTNTDDLFDTGVRSVVAHILNRVRSRDYDRLLKLIEERVAENDEEA